MKFKRDVHFGGDAWDVNTEYAIIEITPQLYKRILELHKAVTSVNATYIEEFDYTPDFYTDEDKKSEDRLDCVMLKVSKDDILWEGLLKHTDISWSIESIPFNLLKEMHKVKRARKERLPLYIGKLKTDEAKALLEERMK